MNINIDLSHIYVYYMERKRYRREDTTGSSLHFANMIHTVGLKTWLDQLGPNI